MKIDLRKYADYSFFDRDIKRGKRILPRPEEMIEVNGQLPELDIRSVDCSKLDLSGYNEDRITFDDKTVFPIDERKMPRNFNPSEIMEKQKNRGLVCVRYTKEDLEEKDWLSRLSMLHYLNIKNI